MKATDAKKVKRRTNKKGAPVPRGILEKIN